MVSTNVSVFFIPIFIILILERRNTIVSRIKEITVEIDGDTATLDKS